MLLFPPYSFIMSCSLIMSSKRSRVEKSKQSESSSRTKNIFVSENAMYKHSIIYNKIVISGRCVVLADFDHLDLTPFLKTNSLDHFLTIKEQVYPDLVQYFYCKLSFIDNHIKSRVKNMDINISLKHFARIFKLSCDAVEIFYSDLHDFKYPDGESALTASRLLYDNDNLGLVRNKEVKCYILHAQVFAKIIFHDLLPKLGKYSHACGCAPLLIYCLLKGIKVNIPYFIIDFMLSDHLLIPTRNLPYRMILTHLFKHFKINLSDERAINPSVDINSTLLKGCILVLMFRLLLILHHLLSSILSLVPPL